MEDVVEIDVLLTEKKFFKTRKVQLDKNKKKNVTDRKKKKRDGKMNYKRNKAKIKKKQKIYRRKAKARPNSVRTHR